MATYRVLRDFGSHLGNHYRGERLNLPEGSLPRGFEGFVERVAAPETKDLAPASGRTDDAPADAGPPAAVTDADQPPPPPAGDPPSPEEPPTPADQAKAGYSDKAIRPRQRP